MKSHAWAERRLGRFLSNPAAVAYETSKHRWHPRRHLRHLSRELRRVAQGKTNRLMVFMPPRHGKSETVSRWFPAWYLNVFPDRRIMLASYEASFASHWGEQARGSWNEMRNIFGGELTLSRDRSDWWMIAGHGGYMTTTGVGGPLTGKGANLGIIDDPIKNADEAFSKAYRERLWNWYLSTFLTRLEPGGAIVVMLTRWHEDDLAGRLLKREGQVKDGGIWKVVSLPALAGEADPIGRLQGEALWPSRFPVAELAKIRTSIGDRWWSALYGQDPQPMDSAARREWFSVIDRVPDGVTKRIRGWDLAATVSKQADYLCGAKLYRAGNLFVVADVVRRQIGPAHVAPLIRSTAEQDGASVSVVVEQEPAASGKIAANVITSALSGFPVRTVVPSGDKLLRATPFLDQCRAGNVVLLRGSWNDAFLDEVTQFPNGEHDDVVDACAHAFNAMTASRSMVL